MARTAVATLQSVRDCRWSHLELPADGIGLAREPEAAWVCTRRGALEPVTEEECEFCPHWEERPAQALS